MSIEREYNRKIQEALQKESAEFSPEEIKELNRRHSNALAGNEMDLDEAFERIRRA